MKSPVVVVVVVTRQMCGKMSGTENFLPSYTITAMEGAYINQPCLPRWLQASQGDSYALSTPVYGPGAGGFLLHLLSGQVLLDAESVTANATSGSS